MYEGGKTKLWIAKCPVYLFVGIVQRVQDKQGTEWLGPICPLTWEVLYSPTCPFAIHLAMNHNETGN